MRQKLKVGDKVYRYRVGKDSGTREYYREEGVITRVEVHLAIFDRYDTEVKVNEHCTLFPDEYFNGENPNRWLLDRKGVF